MRAGDEGVFVVIDVQDIEEEIYQLGTHLLCQKNLQSSDVLKFDTLRVTFCKSLLPSSIPVVGKGLWNKRSLMSPQADSVARHILSAFPSKIENSEVDL